MHKSKDDCDMIGCPICSADQSLGALRCEHNRDDYRSCPHCMGSCPYCMGIGSASPKPSPGAPVREWFINESNFALPAFPGESSSSAIHVIERRAYVALLGDLQLYRQKLESCYTSDQYNQVLAKLQAAESERDELRQNESKLNAALSAKQDIINGLNEDLADLKKQLKSNTSI